jgi:macrolide transport system ATP-binding/permease protein
VQALRGISHTVERGEFVAGPNKAQGSSGSGESTLIGSGLPRPTKRPLFFEGIDVADLPELALARIRSERLGFVFHSVNLLARTSASENVAPPLFDSPPEPAMNNVRLARARAALALLGLGDRERNGPGQLSGGQQRVAIASALNEITNTLQSLNREQGVTIHGCHP